MKCTAKHRAEILRYFCHRNNTKSSYWKSSSLTDVFPNIFVDDKHKILFCIIPKAGHSSWKTLLMEIASNKSHILGKVHDTRNERIHGVYSLGSMKGGKLNRLKTYYKVMAVRHPFTRLLSAYKNKFFDNTTMVSKAHGKYILDNYRLSISNMSRFYATRPTWEEFVRFVAADEKLHYDVHWQGYEDLCRPCQIHYDAVVKLESIHEDSHQLLSRLGLVEQFSIGHFNPSVGEGGKANLEYFRELSNQTFEDLKLTFRRDMTMFGYGLEGKRQITCGYRQWKDQSSASGNVSDLDCC